MIFKIPGHVPTSALDHECTEMLIVPAFQR